MTVVAFDPQDASTAPEEINQMIQKRLVHEIHTSERRSFRGCRRRWDWVFQDFYYPQITAKPLEFGVAFHDAMEVIHDPVTWKWDPQVRLARAIKVFVEKCDSQFREYAKNYEPTAEVKEDYEERIALGKGMLKYYVNEVSPQYDAGWRPVHVEVEFLVHIKDPSTGRFLFCKCKRCVKTQIEYDEAHDIARDWDYWEGLVVCLAGRIDMLVEDPDGHYWIVDWKTTARLARGDVSGQDRDEFLDLDDQIGSYVMALRRKLGLDVRGFVYVELKKAFPEEPKRNVQRRLGCMYSINKNQAVDHKTFLKCVIDNDREAYEAGYYDKFLEWLQEEGPSYHGRYQIVKLDEELEEIERGLFQEASDMCDPNLRIYPSPGRFSCGFCAFRQPCLEKYRQGDYLYLLDSMFEKRDKHYWVKELSTDKQGGE